MSIMWKVSDWAENDKAPSKVIYLLDVFSVFCSSNLIAGKFLGHFYSKFVLFHYKLWMQNQLARSDSMEKICDQRLLVQTDINVS